MNGKGKNIKESALEGSYATQYGLRRRLYRFTKFTRGRFFIGLMHPDGSSERLIAEGYLTEGPTDPGGRVLSFLDKHPKKMVICGLDYLL